MCGRGRRAKEGGGGSNVSKKGYSPCGSGPPFFRSLVSRLHAPKTFPEVKARVMGPKEVAGTVHSEKP